MQHPPLTKRQRQILDFYRSYGLEHGLSPTLEEVAQAFELNKVTIFGHVAELERKGLLMRSQKGISRGILPTQGVDPDRLSEGEASVQKSTSVTIRGLIAAGSPIEALEDLETFDLSELLRSGGDVYALRVRGDSMIEDGIHDGDLVLIEARKEAKPRETIVAVLESGEATLKRYVPLKGGRARLEPANSALQPFEVDTLDIRGVLIGVIRQVKNS